MNLQDYRAEELLASPDWGDNLWALGAAGDPPVVLREVLGKLLRLPPEFREEALAELMALSGILKLGELLEHQLKQFPMLDFDLKDHAVVRPLIEQDRREGLREGLQEGRQALLLDQLAEKFGPVPTWAQDRVHAATPEQLDRWARRVLRSTTLETTLD